MAPLPGRKTRGSAQRLGQAFPATRPLPQQRLHAFGGDGVGGGVGLGCLFGAGHGQGLLVAEDVDYDTIVQVMDAVRVRQSTVGGKVVRRELFPLIALGDAPT